jgi:hypothetical protein
MNANLKNFMSTAKTITRILLFLTITQKIFYLMIVIWKEDELARILIVDDEKDSVVVVRDDHIEQVLEK